MTYDTFVLTQLILHGKDKDSGAMKTVMDAAATKNGTVIAAALASVGAEKPIVPGKAPLGWESLVPHVMSWKGTRYDAKYYV